MINIFINYNCNLNCDYCFSITLRNKYPVSMDFSNFEKLCSWLVENDVYTVGILGGEPTLHKDLTKMLKLLNENGIAVVLFTNGLFDNLDFDFLVKYVYNFVINYNNPEYYTLQQYKLLNYNINELCKRNAEIAFSKNFSTNRMDYRYLIEAARKHNIKRIRYDISRPNYSSSNAFYDLDSSKSVIEQIVQFVKECDSYGILTGLDCCEPLCYYDANDLKMLTEKSMKFSGMCCPSMDVHTDLSATYCIPLQNIRVDSVLDFAGEIDLMNYFLQSVKNMRAVPKDDKCNICDKFGRSCQGGCLALKTQS